MMKGNKPSVLVVEDDVPIRNLITTTLEMEKYKFDTAENGNQAIMLAAANNPDIILMDLGLPDIDGIEVIRKIRTWSVAPIIVISARSDEKDKVAALDVGADDYLTKPFSVTELSASCKGFRRGSTFNAFGIQSALSIGTEYRKGADLPFYSGKSMAKRHYQRYFFSACVYGFFAQKTGKRQRTFRIYPNTYRRRVS